MKHSRIKQRVVWAMNPVTRTIPSKKNYKRTQSKMHMRNEINTGER